MERKGQRKKEGEEGRRKRLRGKDVEERNERKRWTGRNGEEKEGEERIDRKGKGRDEGT